MRARCCMMFAMSSVVLAAGLAAQAAPPAVPGEPASVLPNVNKLTDAE